MTDVTITILIIGGCALFLGVRAFQSFQGKSTGCGCAKGCGTSDSSVCVKPELQVSIQQMPKLKK